MFKSRKHYIGVLAIKQKEINVAEDIYKQYRREYFECLELGYHYARTSSPEKGEDLVERSHQLYEKYLRAYCRYLDLVCEFESLELKVGLKYYA